MIIRLTSLDDLVEVLRRGRARLDLGQSDLAERAGLGPGTIQRWERKTSQDALLETVVAVLGALGLVLLVVPEDELVLVRAHVEVERRRPGRPKRVPPVPAPPAPRRLSDREKQIAAEWRPGELFQDTARRLGLSRAYTAKVLKRAGCVSPWDKAAFASKMGRNRSDETKRLALEQRWTPERRKAYSEYKRRWWAARRQLEQAKNDPTRQAKTSSS